MRRLAPLLATVALAVPAGAAAQEPFSPEIRATVDAERSVPPLGHPPLTVTILQDEGEATLRRTDVLLPQVLFPDADALLNVCPARRFEAGRCPRRSRIGTAEADSPLLEEPLRGPVLLVEALRSAPGRTGLTLPRLVVQLAGGPLHIELQAAQRYRGDGRLLTVFRGLPEVPVQRFELRFEASRRGPLQARAYLCARPLGKVEVRLFSHDGRSVRRARRVAVPECRRRPSLRVGIRGLRSDAPRVRVRVRRGPEGAPLHAVRFTLPRDRLRVARTGTPAGVTVRADGRRVAPSRWSLGGDGRLRIRLAEPADRVVATIGGGAVRPRNERPRRPGADARTTVIVRALLRERGGQTTPLALKVRARR